MSFIYIHQSIDTIDALQALPPGTLMWDAEGRLCFIGPLGSPVVQWPGSGYDYAEGILARGPFRALVEIAAERETVHEPTFADPSARLTRYVTAWSPDHATQ